MPLQDLLNLLYRVYKYCSNIAKRHALVNVCMCMNQVSIRTCWTATSTFGGGCICCRNCKHHISREGLWHSKLIDKTLIIIKAIPTEYSTLYTVWVKECMNDLCQQYTPVIFDMSLLSKTLELVWCNCREVYLVNNNKSFIAFTTYKVIIFRLFLLHIPYNQYLKNLHGLIWKMYLVIVVTTFV